MRLGYWVGIGLAGILVLGIFDYQNHFENILSPPITREKVISEVQQALTQNGEVPAHLQTIHFDTKDGKGFALVTYQFNGQPHFAIIIASQIGYGMASASFPPDQKVPIRLFSTSSNGWEFIAGVVNDHPEVKNVVIIFSNGIATSVPVRNGCYWYTHQVSSTNTNVHILKVIGVTKTGGILSNQKQKVGSNNSNEDRKAKTNPLFQTALKLPNGKVITPNQTVQWKDLAIQLLVTSLPPSYVTTNKYVTVVGNHSTIISHKTITTSAGQATLVLNKRTQPAASKSSAVTYEYWVIIYGSQYAYAIDATVIGNLNKAKSEVIQLSQQWSVPH